MRHALPPPPRRARPTASALLFAMLAAACEPAADTPDGGRPAPADAGSKADAGPMTDARGSGDAGPSADARAPGLDAAVAPTDAGAPADAAPMTGDRALLTPPSEDSATKPLFDPTSPDAQPIDTALAAIVEAWATAPQDEASAQAHVQKLRDALRELREAGPTAADRLADVCAQIPVHATGHMQSCLRLLGLVDSPRSLDFLMGRARLVAEPYPAGAHPVDPPAEALAAAAALDALVGRTRAGTRLAGDLLLRMVADPQNPDRGPAVAAVLRALPRAEAKRRLRAVLPENEIYRLYQTR